MPAYPAAMFELPEIERRLQAVASARFGAELRVERMRRLAGGHAGFTFAFDLRRAEEPHPRGAVIKLSPPGVRRCGVANVFRQATLLRALYERGIPVPRILWADEHETDLGSPYIVMEWVEGREHFPLLGPGDSIPQSTAHTVWSQAIETIAALARFPALDALRGWEMPMPLAREFAGWEATLRKSPEPRWIDAGLRARDALARCMPRNAVLALVHGDFQPSNLLFDGGALRAIIDWDLAHLGSSGLDLGWLMMFGDPDYWGRHWRVWCPFAASSMVGQYVQAGGPLNFDPQWFHAYAGYRFGAIACLNVRVHRSGRRPDAIWERFALDIPRLFDRACGLAQQLPSS